MSARILFILVYSFLIGSTKAQLNRYLVQFKDKNNSPFSLQQPNDYLSEKAIARRLRYQIQIDSFDLPVNPNYIKAVRAIANVSVLNASKWLNSISKIGRAHV